VIATTTLHISEIKISRNTKPDTIAYITIL
jgi:hypothetical protein